MGALLCYADALLVTRGKNGEEAVSSRRYAEVGANVLVRRIEEIGLKVAIEKTEAVIFGPGRDKFLRELNIDGKTVRTRTSMKYLGVIVDDKYMGEHLDYAANKGLKAVNRLCRNMPNIGGLKESKRKLYNVMQ